MRVHKSIEDCEGCESEMWECFLHQEAGYNAGLEFSNGHVFMFSIDPKTNEWIVPYYNLKLLDIISLS